MNKVFLYQKINTRNRDYKQMYYSAQFSINAKNI